ncbi:hypothetical protein F2P56_004093 [Juglans regia]|uniref:Retrotransposon Copia-like N-terminal domain-containing protein n=1 Tax=Juglans regia TaxID=51240 RepID=A0A834D5S9_JUGRE|nr:hypothetical protein F2P56_004093 [Juglans regia]
MAESSNNNFSENSSFPLGNPSDDSSSHYYLHPSDNPGVLLVSEIFSGDNYVAWSRSITIALTVKNKVAFIDGSLPQPNSTNSRLKIAWLRANNLVLSWLMNSIAKDIRGSLLYFNSAADIWNELKIRYLRSDGPRVFALEKSLSSISQGSNSVTEYFSAFKALWDEHISYRPLPTCNCGFLEKCTCAVLKNLADQQEADYIMKFLIGLNDSFSAIRSQLLLLSPLPSMGKVFSLLIQEESQRSLTNAVHIPLDSHAMAAAQPSTQTYSNAVKFSKVKGKSDVICSHCGFSGHLVDKCFQLIGYPPGWKGPRGKRINSTRLSNANMASSMEQNLNNPTMFFSQEQIQNLITLANSLSTSSTNPNPAVNTASTSGPQQMEDDWAC